MYLQNNIVDSQCTKPFEERKHTRRYRTASTNLGYFNFPNRCMARKETPTRRKGQTTLFDHHREPLHFQVPNRGTPSSSLDLGPSPSKDCYRPGSLAPFSKTWVLYHEARVYGGEGIDDVAIIDVQ